MIDLLLKYIEDETKVLVEKVNAIDEDSGMTYVIGFAKYSGQAIALEKVKKLIESEMEKSNAE